VGTLIGLTEGERLGVLSALAVVLAASIPACIAAWSSLRTRRENSRQHSGVHDQLTRLASSVEAQTGKIDNLRDDVADLRESAHQIAKRVDHAHERIDHQSWLRPDK